MTCAISLKVHLARAFERFLPFRKTMNIIGCMPVFYPLVFIGIFRQLELGILADDLMEIVKLLIGPVQQRFVSQRRQNSQTRSTNLLGCFPAEAAMKHR